MELRGSDLRSASELTLVIVSFRLAYGLKNLKKPKHIGDLLKGVTAL